jgi:hypothetical protein
MPRCRHSTVALTRPPWFCHIRRSDRRECALLFALLLASTVHIRRRQLWNRASLRSTGHCCCHGVPPRSRAAPTHARFCRRVGQACACVACVLSGWCVPRRSRVCFQGTCAVAYKSEKGPTDQYSYFDQAITMHTALNAIGVLTNAGIVPSCVILAAMRKRVSRSSPRRSSSKTYTYSETWKRVVWRVSSLTHACAQPRSRTRSTTLSAVSERRVSECERAHRLLRHSLPRLHRR